MYSRIISPQKDKSFFLFGPRGTGKTMWVRTTYPSAIYLDLLRPDVFNDLTARPERLEDMIPPHYGDWIVIDEVQKIPELLNEVHRLIESRRLKFILTGSSARKLRRQGTNLLAGRALTSAMHPLTVHEVGSDFQLERALKFGQLPSVYVEGDPQLYLESYVKTYLKEEVVQEGLTRNLGAFSRFLEAASFSHAQVINVSEVARECAVERKVVQHYFTILEDMLMAVHLPVFTKRTKRKMVAHPKFYFFDVGVFRTVRPMGPLDRPEEVEGAAYESLFLQELRALNDYARLGYSLSYWRTANQQEVDFVLYGERGIKAFEIKRTGRVSTSDLSGLKSFLDDYPIAKAYLVYGGKDREYRENITLIPYTECLQELPKLLG